MHKAQCGRMMAGRKGVIRTYIACGDTAEMPEEGGIGN